MALYADSGPAVCSSSNQCRNSGRLSRKRTIKSALGRVCTAPGIELYSFVVTDDAEREKDEVWTNLCRESGWVCRICEAVPERGQQFADNLCDDCRKIARNE